MATIGDPEAYIKECKALFICGTPFASTKGMDGRLNSDFKKAQELLKEAGYDGTPIVLMHSTDLQILTNLAPVAKIAAGESRLQGRHAVHGLADAGGAARQKRPADGRRLARLPNLLGIDRMHQSRFLPVVMNSACDKAMFGWPCDSEMEKARALFRPRDHPAKQKAIAEQVSVRVGEVVTHIPLGQWYLGAVPCATTSTACSCASAGVLEHRSPSELSGASGDGFSARAVPRSSW